MSTPNTLRTQAGQETEMPRQEGNKIARYLKPIVRVHSGESVDQAISRQSDKIHQLTADQLPIIEAYRQPILGLSTDHLDDI